MRGATALIMQGHEDYKYVHIYIYLCIIYFILKLLVTCKTPPTSHLIYNLISSFLFSKLGYFFLISLFIITLNVIIKKTKYKLG